MLARLSLNASKEYDADLVAILATQGPNFACFIYPIYLDPYFDVSSVCRHVSTLVIATTSKRCCQASNKLSTFQEEILDVAVHAVRQVGRSVYRVVVLLAFPAVVAPGLGNDDLGYKLRRDLPERTFATAR